MEESGLYCILLSMERAAARGDRDEVIGINDRFIQEYDRVMPLHYGSLPQLYDTARNKLVNSVDTLLFSADERRRELELGRKKMQAILRRSTDTF